MDAIPDPRPPSDDRLLAALAHLSAILPGIGALAPLVIWFTQRKKSAYVTYQALQALGYQVLVYELWLILITVLMFIAMIVLLPLVGAASSRGSIPDFLFFLPQMAMMGLYFGSIALYILTGLVGAGMCLAGRNFQYPLLGKWLENYLKEGAA